MVCSAAVVVCDEPLKLSVVRTHYQTTTAVHAVVTVLLAISSKATLYTAAVAMLACKYGSTMLVS
jgi:hypothetical protein